MDFTEKQLKSEAIFHGRIMDVRRDVVLLPDGGQSVREVIDKSGAVCVLPLFANGDVGMVRQFRYPFLKEVLEIPAGKLDGDETPLEGAVRELSEETGLSAGRYDYLGEMYPAAAYTNEVVHIYLARELTEGKQHLDPGEFLSYEAIPLSQLEDMVMANEIPDAKTALAVLKTAAFLVREKRV